MTFADSQDIHNKVELVRLPQVAEVRSLERRLIGWMLVFWGTGIFAIAGATLAIVRL